MVSEAHGMSYPCTELLLFNYAKVKTVFHSMSPFKVQARWLLMLSFPSVVSEQSEAIW